MANIPKRTLARLVAGIKSYQQVLTSAKARDVGEADTVTIVKDMLADVFGYDKYAEVTSEHAIRGTYCDLAIKLDGALQFLIEVKAIGLDLKDMHVKQAVDYAANQGVDWVVLTNGIIWRVYRITFAKPISNELIVEVDFCGINSRNEAEMEALFLWCKEGWSKSALGDYHTQRQALSRFFVGAMLLTDPVLDVIRRELRRISPDVRIANEEIQKVLSSEVIKREVMEGEKAEEAKKRIVKASKKALRAASTRKEASSSAKSAADADEEELSLADLVAMGKPEAAAPNPLPEVEEASLSDLLPSKPRFS